MHMKWKYALAESRKGGSMSGMIVLLMNWEYAHPDQEWREHVSYNCAAYELEMRTF